MFRSAIRAVFLQAHIHVRFAIRIPCLLVVCLLAGAVVGAQRDWTVTVTPTLNPLPVGLCAAVRLTVVDAAGETPRNARGARVTIADFDMTVSGASVAGNQIDASHFDVCACQGGSAGSMATVTAAYPSRRLAAADRIEGVEVERTATFTLAAPKGSADPPPCTRPSVETLSSAVPLANDAVRGRVPPYRPGPATATFTLSASGTWYEPGPVTATFDLKADGTWYVPGPVTATFDLSASGNWIERGVSPGGALNTAPQGR